MQTGAPGGDTGPWFAALSQELMKQADVKATLDKICQRSLDVVPSGDFAGITVRRRRARLETLAHSHEMALRCDELQYDLGEGPCAEAAIEDESFLVRSTADDPRWPRWGPAVARLGVHSLISVQLPGTAMDADRDPLGAINIYARKVDAFTTSDLARAKLFAIHAANALTTAQQVSTLSDAVEARHQIGVAQGVLTQRYGIDVERAFGIMQRYSSHANIKLRDVAVSVVELGELPAAYDDLSRPEKPTG
ncbi:GAF domain-containing protein [Nocardioides daedukensis]|uniref:GAF domain-containing protein n=1 Tax=Nocardioides daedukensis TaxID=634462 RepID=A0A7Y9S012_9ACTN|nr:GAF and ANTAR domain-containing protein [Nocardioides daedukensis]NYG57249.1 GAF domain-containing protein [Nocardioides daedukensis]